MAVQTEVITWGVKDLKAGTKGYTKQGGGHGKPTIRNLYLRSDEALGPVGTWGPAYAVPAGNSLTADNLVFAARYNVGGAAEPEVEGFFTLSTAGIFFIEYGTLIAYAANTTAAAQNHLKSTAHVSQINSTLWLVDELLIDLSGPVAPAPRNITLTDVSGAIDTAFSLTSLQCKGSAWHGGRAFYFGSDFTGTSYASSEVLYWSDLNDPGVFTASDQKIELPGTISGVHSVGSNLVIWTEDGFLYMLTGRGDPALATLQELGSGYHPKSRGTTYRRKMFFQASTYDRLVSLDEDGNQDPESLKHLGLHPYTSAESTAPVVASLVHVNSPAQMMSAVTDLPFSAQNGYPTQYVYMLKNGMWAEEDHPVQPVAGSSYQFFFDKERAYDVCLYSDDDASTHVHYFRESDDATWIGTGASQGNALIALPRIRKPNDERVRVRRVIIDLEYIGDGDTTYEASTLGVTVNGVALGSDHASFGAETSWSLGDDPLEARVVFGAGPVAFEDWQDVEITSLNVLFHQISVEIETYTKA